MAKKYKTAQALEFILESITDGFFTLDNHLNITYVNKAFEEICGVKRETVAGLSYWDLFPEAKSQKFFTVFNNVLKTRESEYFEEYATSLNKWVSIAVYTNPDGLSVYFRDLTEQKKYIRIIETQNEQLKEIAWMVSHRLRKPVATILGLSQLLNKGTISDKENLKVIDGLIEEVEGLDYIIKEIDIKTHVLGDLDIEG